MRVFGIAASTREGSLNRRLYDRVAADLAARGHDLETLDYGLFEDLPIYTDRREKAGFPAVLDDVAAAVRDADALVIASPEHNFSMPASLKNGIDWLSRMAPPVFAGKRVMLMSASASGVGGWRGLSALRQSLLMLGAHAYPWEICVGAVFGAEKVDEALASEPLKTRVGSVVGGFLGNVPLI